MDVQLKTKHCLVVKVKPRETLVGRSARENSVNNSTFFLNNRPQRAITYAVSVERAPFPATRCKTMKALPNK